MNIAEQIRDIILLIMLALCSLTDIRYRRLYLPALLFPVPGLLLCAGMVGHPVFFLIVQGIATWRIFAWISRVTGEQIGRGDAVLFGVTGVGLGLWSNLALLCISFFYAFLLAVILVVCCKAGKKQRIPLAPVVLAAFITGILAEYGFV